MSKKRQPWRKFYSKDWRGDAPLRMCSFAARGLWVDLLSLMHESKHCGFLFVDEVVPTPRQLAGLLGGSEKEIRGLLAELADNGVFSVTGQDMPDDVKALVPAGMPDGVMLSRRMVRDEAKAAKDRENGKGGGNPGSLSPDVTPGRIMSEVSVEGAVSVKYAAPGGISDQRPVSTVIDGILSTLLGNRASPIFGVAGRT